MQRNKRQAPPRARAVSAVAQVETRAAASAAPAPAERRGTTGPFKSRTPVDLAAAVVSTFRVNERMNQFLLEGLDRAVWDASPPDGKGRTVAAIFSHMHNVRHMWLAVSAAGPGPLPAKVDRRTLTIPEARSALRESAVAITALFEAALAEGGYIRNFKPDVVGFLGYIVSHEAHHRGQICTLARQLGHKLPDPVSYGMWDWGKRAAECES